MAKQTFTTGQILTAAQMTTLQANDYNWTVNAKTASYVLVATDAGTRVTMNSASATTITVNTSLFTAGDTLEIINIGAGVCTVTAGTATVSTSATLALKQYDAGTLYFTSTSASIFLSSDAAGDPLTTKGDLYTYSTDNARLAVGANGTSLVADSSQTTGLGWTATPAASNPVINSNMSVWQRGTSISVAASSAAVYTADRWQINAVAASQACTVSRQATGDTTNLANIQYAFRFQRNSGQTGLNNMQIAQSFESINSIPFAGKTVTFSFYARAGANYSSASNALPVYVASGTGTDQNILSGLTGVTYPINSTATLTTTWQRFTYTGTIPTTSTQLAISAYYTPTGTAGTNDYFEITGVQLDIGSVALPYRSTSTTYQQELAACQRYYWQIVTGSGSTFALVDAEGSNTPLTYIQAPVTMRIAPTLIQTTGASYYVARSVAGLSTLNSFTTENTTTSGITIYGSATITAGNAGRFISNNASSSLALSSEL